MAGFIKFDRDIFEEPYFSDGKYSRRMAFMDLCYMANYKQGSVIIRGNVVPLQPMQLAKSADYLASRWMWNKRTVLCFLSTLQELGYITLQKNRIITVITIKKGICDALQNTLQTAPQNTPQTALQTALPTNKEIKKEINIEKEDTTVSKKKSAEKKFDVREDLSYVDCFEGLWREWLDYKDEIKKQYKTQRGAKSAFSQLKNLSKGNPMKAREILEQSYRKSWDGFFDVKDYQTINIPQQDLFTNADESVRELQTVEQPQSFFYAFNVRFSTQTEADAFSEKQERIRRDYFDGKLIASSDRVDEHLRVGDAVRVEKGVIYDYEER